MKGLVVDTEDAHDSTDDFSQVTLRRYKADTDQTSLHEENDVLEEILSLVQSCLNKQSLGRTLQKDSTLLQKLSYTKSLVSEVCSLLTVDPFKRNKPKSKSVVLSQEDCEILCELLNSPTKKIPSVSKVQGQYTDLGQKLLKSQAQLRKKEDEMEHLTETNIRLRSGCKVMNQQIKSLEQQLVESMEETYKLQDEYHRVMTELTNYRAVPQTPSWSEECFSFSTYLPQ
jgi:hypothetical protein